MYSQLEDGSSQVVNTAWALIALISAGYHRRDRAPLAAAARALLRAQVQALRPCFLVHLNTARSLNTVQPSICEVAHASQRWLCLWYCEAHLNLHCWVYAPFVTTADESCPCPAAPARGSAHTVFPHVPSLVYVVHRASMAGKLFALFAVPCMCGASVSGAQAARVCCFACPPCRLLWHVHHGRTPRFALPDTASATVTAVALGRKNLLMPVIYQC